MTEQQTPDPLTPPPDERETLYEPASPGMPRWVPVLIGVVLVALASLAVVTGLRYHAEDVTEARPRNAARTGAFAPPGEPGAGASRVMHNADADQTPAANTAVAGPSRAVISGGREGVETVVRMWARRGMLLEVEPNDAMVYVNDVLIGNANQFDTADEIYDFAEPGSYTVRLVTPNGTSRTYVVTAADDAKVDVARIAAKL
jgi:hypothetical protein